MREWKLKGSASAVVMRRVVHSRWLSYSGFSSTPAFRTKTFDVMRQSEDDYYASQLVFCAWTNEKKVCLMDAQAIQIFFHGWKVAGNKPMHWHLRTLVWRWLDDGEVFPNPYGSSHLGRCVAYAWPKGLLRSSHSQCGIPCWGTRKARTSCMPTLHSLPSLRFKVLF